MSRKLPRLLFVASLVAGASLAPMLDAAAEPRNSSVDVYDPAKGGFVVPHAPNPRRLDINPGDTVTWNIIEGEHNVTPRDLNWWGQPGSGDLTPGSPRYTAEHFDKPGNYVYYCSIHGGIDANNEPTGMWGVIHVIDPNPPAPPPPPPPSNNTPPPTAAPTTTTRPVVTTTSPPATSAGSKTPTSAAPAPTTTTKGKDKNKKPKEEETTTTTAPPPPAPIDLPSEAIVPSLPGFGPTGTTTQDGIEAPEGTPEGDAVALLKSGKGGGGNAKKLLIVSGLGLGVLGLGAGGYKYANRSSKYFPA